VSKHKTPFPSSPQLFDLNGQQTGIPPLEIVHGHSERDLNGSAPEAFVHLPGGIKPDDCFRPA
jgi:hypothetical protein